MKFIYLGILVFLISFSSQGNECCAPLQYYQSFLYAPPNPALEKAIDSFSVKKSKTALDLGAGVGNETAYLLQNGWKVWAIDGESLSQKTILNREDINTEQRQNLTFILSRYADVNWKTIPSVDLIMASHSLLAINKADYKKVWRLISSKLKPGGKFVGNFFGLNQGDFLTIKRSEMLLLSADQIKELFKDYDLEMFQEVDNKKEIPAGNTVHYHAYTIIARKKVS